MRLTRLVAATMIAALPLATITPAQASVSISHPAATSTHIPTPCSAKRLSEKDLLDIGLTKQDAEDIAKDFRDAVREATKSGDLSTKEATDIIRALAPETAPDPRAEEIGSEIIVQPRILPAWAAAAIVGCVGSIMYGSVRNQIGNLLKHGKIDEATDIGIDVALDCVWGAVPGGALVGFLKSKLAKPIKDALRPHVKKLINKMRGDSND